MEKPYYFKKQSEALVKDAHREQLFKRLFDLYAKSEPIILKEQDGTISCMYPDAVEELAQNIREQIIIRDNEVFNSLSA